MSSVTSMKKVSYKQSFIPYKWFLFSCWILISVLYMTVAILNNHVANLGNKVAELEFKKQQLIQERQELTNEVAQLSSLLYIEPKAHALGFRPIERLVFFK
jgi:cell division protein FtsB